MQQVQRSFAKSPEPSMTTSESILDLDLNTNNIRLAKQTDEYVNRLRKKGVL